MSNSFTPAAKQSTSNESIMALFCPPQQQQPSGYGMQSMAGMGQVAPSNNAMMGGMMPQLVQQNNQSQTSSGMIAFGNAGMSMMMNGNPGFTINTNIANNNHMIMQQQQQQQQQQQMMHNMMMGGGNMMMNPQMQQQMMMMQQQQNQPQMGNVYNSSQFNNFNSMTQGMQNMNIGGIASQSTDDGGFGAPMGGSAQNQSVKHDPFSSLGGMNAFR
jgi:hypothetical protein